MAEKIVVKVNREAAIAGLEATTIKQEKLRKKFESESFLPLVNKGPLGAFVYGVFMYPRIFFSHIIMENPKYSLSIFQETILRSVKYSINSPLKTLRRSGAIMESFIKTFHCSEPFRPLEPEVKREIGIKGGYWLGPVKYKGRESEATILYLHGGGYIALSSLIGLKSLCYLLKILRKRYNRHVRVLAIDYALAPEGPFPTGLNCAEKAYKWLINSGIAGSQNVFLFGDSAGGGLSLALLQKLNPDNTTTRIPLPLGVILVSPWVELSCDSLSYFTNANSDWISGHLCQFAAEYYIWGKEGNPAHKRNKVLQQQPRINRDIILDWLERVEDNIDLVDFEGNSRFKRFSLELSKRLSISSSITSKRRSDIKAKRRGSKGAIISKRNSRIRDSFTEKITIDPDEVLPISESFDEKLKKRKSYTEEEIKKEQSHIEEEEIKGERSYTEENPYRDPLISPLHIPHNTLANFPPLFITYGGKEVFRDDIEMFIQKCIESKRVYTMFNNYDYNESSLDGQHPDVIVETDEEMIHDYPMFIDVFGKHSKKALDRIVHFIANKIPFVPSPIQSFQAVRTQSIRPIPVIRPKSNLRIRKSHHQTQSLAETAIKFSTLSSSRTAVDSSPTESIVKLLSPETGIYNANSPANLRLSSTSINSRRIPSVVY
uniref:Monoterpene epsilon-lactone hydrolase n=1 Tax=Anthurium amnicola TaxID=1678845 RepID=A0A1D1Z3S3_9ARAE